MMEIAFQPRQELTVTEMLRIGIIGVQSKRMKQPEVMSSPETLASRIAKKACTGLASTTIGNVVHE